MRVGAIDNPDRFEDSFEPNYVQEVVEIIFTRSISKVRPHKPPKNRLFWHLVRLLLRFYAIFWAGDPHFLRICILCYTHHEMTI